MNKQTESRERNRISEDLLASIHFSSHVVLARIVDIHSDGAQLVSEDYIDSETVIIKGILNQNIEINSHASITWRNRIGPLYSYGFRFIEKSVATHSALSLLERVHAIESRKWGRLLSVTLFLGIPLLLTYCFSLAYFFNDRPYANGYAILIFVLISERLWETFYTSKDQKAFKRSADWTITAVSFYYLVLYAISASEYYIRNRQNTLLPLCTGFLFLIISAFIRWWGMKSLTNQWSVHVIKNNRLHNNSKLIQSGPYRYVRHPIYLAFIFELLAIPLVLHSTFGLLFSCLVSIPLQILRSKLEEKDLINRLGISYLKYLVSTPAIIPAFKKIKTQR